MKNLIIAPTLTYKRGPLRKEINDTIKDSKDFVVTEQKVDSIMPENSDLSGPQNIAEQKVYQDMQVMHKFHNTQREKELGMFLRDLHLEYNPMHNISFPDMKLRKQP